MMNLKHLRLNFWIPWLRLLPNKKSLEDDTQSHEGQTVELRHKHTQEVAAINEQLENIKKGKTALEKLKQSLEAENSNLTTELRNVGASRQESKQYLFKFMNEVMYEAYFFTFYVCIYKQSGLFLSLTVV